MTWEPQPKGDALHALIEKMKARSSVPTAHILRAYAPRIEELLAEHDAQVRAAYEATIPHELHCNSLNLYDERGLCDCGKAWRIAGPKA